LNLKCKIYEGNKKTEKEKEENKIKIEKGLGESLGPDQRKEPAAHPPSPRTGTPASFLTSLTLGPTGQTRSSSSSSY
jgi:hypothetical protein